MDKIECVIIRHLKGYIRKRYLEFLIKHGPETYKFYKHALKICRCIYLYKDKNTNDIKAIFGIYDTVSIEKYVYTPARCICFISFMYCPNTDLFRYLLSDIEQYAHCHGQPLIVFNHMKIHHNILIESHYDIDDCTTHTTCINCDQQYNDNTNSYYKVISDVDKSRQIYDKKYDPNRDYDAPSENIDCPFNTDFKVSSSASKSSSANELPPLILLWSAPPESAQRSKIFERLHRGQ